MNDWVEVPFESAMLLRRLGWEVMYTTTYAGCSWRQPYGLINKQVTADEYKTFNARWRARPKETE